MSEERRLDFEPEDKIEEFAKVYVSKENAGDPVAAYLQAYDLPQSKAKNIKSKAYHLLREPRVMEKVENLWQEQIEILGLTDHAVDMQLAALIHQCGDFRLKLDAIKEYNRLRQRVIDKLDVTTNGQDLPASQFFIQINQAMKSNQVDEKGD